MSTQKETLRLNRWVMAGEFLLFFVLLFNLSAACSNNSYSELITHQAIFERASIEPKSAVIHLSDRTYCLYIKNPARYYLDREHLARLSAGDTIEVLSRKDLTLANSFNYWMGYQVIVGLREPKTGVVLDAKAYLKYENSLGRRLLRYGIIGLMLPICLLLVFSWCLLFLYYLLPQHRPAWSHHRLLQHKFLTKLP